MEQEMRADESCDYCGPGKYTGLPGGACENCMNTGLKHPELEEIKEWTVETRVVSRRVYIVRAGDEKEAIFATTHVPPDCEEDEFEETMSVVEVSEKYATPHQVIA